MVASDPWRLSDDIMWSVTLCGGWIGTPGMLDSPPSGPCRKLLPALGIRRSLFVSDAFRQQHGHLWVVLLECMNLFATMRWRLLPDAQSWATARAKAEQMRKPAEVLCLLGAQEAADRRGRSSNHVFAPSPFLSWITRMDTLSGALGLARI